VTETALHASSIAERYARAIFDIAKEDNSLDPLLSDLKALEQALRQSEDFNVFLRSPLYNRTQQGAAIVALATQMGLWQTTSNTLALMAAHRRLFALPAFVRILRQLIAQHRGEITAEVITAQPLSSAQQNALSQVLGKKLGEGKTMTLRTMTDKTLIGGLVVRMGSKMIDTSIRFKLNALRNAMQEVR